MIVVYHNTSMSISAQANILYNFIKSERLYNSEATFLIAAFKSSKRYDSMFSDGIIQRTYNKDTIPEPLQLEKEIMEAGRICSCVAAVDPEDDHRVSCTILNEAITLCAYDVESTEALKKIYNEIIS